LSAKPVEKLVDTTSHLDSSSLKDLDHVIARGIQYAPQFGPEKYLAVLPSGEQTTDNEVVLHTLRVVDIDHGAMKFVGKETDVAKDIKIHPKKDKLRDTVWTIEKKSPMGAILKKNNKQYIKLTTQTSKTAPFFVYTGSESILQQVMALGDYAHLENPDELYFLDQTSCQSLCRLFEETLGRSRPTSLLNGIQVCFVPLVVKDDKNDKKRFFSDLSEEEAEYAWNKKHTVSIKLRVSYVFA